MKHSCLHLFLFSFWRFFRAFLRCLRIFYFLISYFKNGNKKRRRLLYFSFTFKCHLFYPHTLHHMFYINLFSYASLTLAPRVTTSFETWALEKVFLFFKIHSHQFTVSWMFCLPSERWVVSIMFSSISVLDEMVFG